MDINLTKKEKKVLISLINMQQFDGSKYTFEGILLDELKGKLCQKKLKKMK